MKPRSDDANAFFPDPLERREHGREGNRGRVRDDFAETLGEDFVQSATSGASAGDDIFDDSVVPEEEGGPFVETSGKQEFAYGTDESNPADAEAEPLPLSSAMSPATAEPGSEKDDEDDSL